MSNEHNQTSPIRVGHIEPTNIANPPIERHTGPFAQSAPVELSQLHSTTSPQNASAIISQPPITLNIQTPSPMSTIPIQEPLSFDGAHTSSIISAPPPALLSDQIGSSSTRDPPESSAIGPSSDGPIIAAEVSTTSGPSVPITLLLITGARHPYTIDQKYLQRRKVAAADEDMDPFNISVYTMKELIWRDWREEWDPRPTSPSSIRLIHFGKLLDDKSTLRDCRFQEGNSNVVHMTVKPQDIVDEEENAKSGKAAGGRDRAGSESEPGCRCCIIQ